MGLTFIAFEGYEIIAQCSEEVHRPERNVPKAIFISLAIVVPIYLAVAFAALGAVHSEGMPSWQFLGMNKETALVDVAKGFFPGGGVMILVGGLLSTLSALNATIYSSSRVSLAMGRDRNLPAFFGKVHATRKTPHGAIAGSAVLIAFMAVALPIEAVASAANIMFLLLFIQVQVVLIALRRKMPEMPRGFRVPLVPYVPAVGIVLQLLLAAYLFVIQPARLVERGRLDRDRLRRLLHLRAQARPGLRACRRNAGGGTAQGLPHPRVPEERRAWQTPILGTAAWLAHGRDAELIGLTVIEVPERVLLAHGLDRLDAARRGLDRAMSRAPLRDVELRSLVKISHRLSYGIAETVLEEQCNVIIIGRTRHTGTMQRLAATVVGARDPRGSRAHAVRERRPLADAGAPCAVRLRWRATHAVCGGCLRIDRERDWRQRARGPRPRARSDGRRAWQGRGRDAQTARTRPARAPRRASRCRLIPRTRCCGVRAAPT